jgi:SPX domain protein involved in polyphosphate accumulation
VYELVEDGYLLDANKFSKYLTGVSCFYKDVIHGIPDWMEGGLLGLKKAVGNNAAQSAALASQRLASIAA